MGHLKNLIFNKRKLILFQKSFKRSLSSSNRGCQIYEQEFQQSIKNPEEYWGKIAEDIVWTKKWQKVLDDSASPFTKWFVGGRLSLCYNALDRHVENGRAGQKALVWDSPITGAKSSLTYLQLKENVSKLSGVLSQLGVQRGDVVLIYMPMIPEAVEAMLATVRLGGIHAVVFGGFAAKELAVRIRHVEPKVILTASYGVEPNKIIQYPPIVAEALEIANAPEVPCVIYQRAIEPSLLSKRDQITKWPKRIIDWKEALNGASDHDCVDVEANDPLYILHTSGTTGDPKAIQHPTGGHAVVNKWTMKSLYGMNPGDTWWAASDLGWVVGHEYICYSPLLAGCTSILYEGKPVGTPDAGQFFRVMSENKVNGFFVAPTALRAIKLADPQTIEGKKYNIDSLKYLFVAGEHCDHETRLWAQDQFKVPVLDNWWQTETAHAIAATCVGLGNQLNPPKDASGKPVPGFDVRILKEDGGEARVNELGRVVCKLPMPPGTLSTLYKAPERFVNAYFQTYPGYYDTCDAGIRDEFGYIHILAREDDVINVAGHRLSTSALEEVILKHPDVAQAAVVGINDELKGSLPCAFYVPKYDVSDQIKIRQELIEMVRKEVGAVAAFRFAFAVPELPRTRSGKTPRKSISDLAVGKNIKISPTVENPNAYSKIKDVLIQNGFL